MPRQLQRLRILDESLEARLLLPIETRCRFPSCSSSRDDWGGWRCHPALIDGFHPSLAGKMSREAPCLGLFLGGMPSRTRLVRTSELRLFPEIEIQTRFLVVKIWREVQRSLRGHFHHILLPGKGGRSLDFSGGEVHRRGMVTDAGSRGKVLGFKPPALVSMGLETRPGCSHVGEAAGRRSVSIGPACRPRWGHGALAAATALHAVHGMGWVGAAEKQRRGSGLMEWAAKERGGLMMQGLGLGTSTSRSVARSSTAAGMEGNGEEKGGGGDEVYERSMSPVERARMEEEEEPMGICGQSWTADSSNSHPPTCPPTHLFRSSPRCHRPLPRLCQAFCFHKG